KSICRKTNFYQGLYASRSSGAPASGRPEDHTLSRGLTRKGSVSLQKALSEAGRRVLGLGWTDIDGPTELFYLENGQLIDNITPYHPDPASLGYVLSPYLRDVPFSETADSEVTLNSFLKVVEKVTEGAISSEWFDTVHNLYRIPREYWSR
ncbi:hypothetical protein, partial [Nonomuraea sp. B1E8]|uniref:hypothetical protein n=1 Tax=unclassified Nonomuraea TaxID=2593643 RepID=UPI00325D32DA